jgi:hypothetical protein
MRAKDYERMKRRVEEEENRRLDAELLASWPLPKVERERVKVKKSH